MSYGISTFQSNKIFLKDLLKDVNLKKIQLPDFQRDWVWDDNRIKSLLASISFSFPIGAVMMLETGNDELRFQPREIEGVKNNSETEPEYLILDGQQRITALYQALLKEGPVDTKDSKNKPIKRHYYINIVESLNNEIDREDAILSISEDKVLKNFRGEITEDYSDPENEYKNMIFPVKCIFDPDEWDEGYIEYWDYDKEKIKLFKKFNNEVLKRFDQYQLPIIQMGKDTPKEAVCLVFEKVNTGGVSLNVFDLLTAMFASENYSLRDDWKEIKKELSEYEVLSKISSDDFLQTITLLSTYNKREISSSGEPDSKYHAISCKRKDILKLSLSDYHRERDKAIFGFKRAAKFFRMQKIFDSRDLPYKTQTVPLAAVFAQLGEDAENDTIHHKLSRWFWCGVFGELYGSTTESRFAKDLPELLAWVRGGDEPTTVKDASFSGQRLEELKTRNSAAYKGVYALLMKEGCEDFRTGQPIDITSYYDEEIDIHHIFPKEWFKKNESEEKIENCVIDCIINKTPISSVTNRKIGGSAPSKYLKKIEKAEKIEKERLDELLKTHLIEPGHLRNDSFWEFYDERYYKMLDKIEKVMGKPVIREESR